MSNEEESLLALLCESLGNGQRGNAPIFINFNSFNGPVGQHNDHADTVNFSMDKDGAISFQHVRRTGKSIIQPEVMAKALLKNRIIRLLNNTNTNLTNPTNNSSNLWSEKSIDVFNVRGVAWKERRDLLREAVTRCKPDLVIVDGIRDLVNDINDGVLAQEVMEELMHLATEHDCCVVCVLHQNKSGEDHNLRGWIGTELMNKAFEVYSCEKLLPQRIFSLEQAVNGEVIMKSYDHAAHVSYALRPQAPVQTEMYQDDGEPF